MPSEELELVCCGACKCTIEESDEKFEVDGETFCETCYNDRYVTCAHCGVVIDFDDAQDYHGDCYCEDCYHAKMSTCDRCGDEYDPDTREHHWGNMCPDCSENHFTCDNCGEILPNDDYGEDGLCQDCYDRNHHNGLVRDYHHPPDLYFLPTHAEPLYFGVELETDRYDNLDRAAETLFSLSEEETIFWMEEDSSLSNGIEIISQPCTLDYHLSKFPWEKIVEIVKENGGKSNDTLTCGLHIHFSRSVFDGKYSEPYQLRLIYLFEKFWDELVIFSRRDISQLHNAEKYNNNLFDRRAKAKMYQLNIHYGRYQAVNIKNENTIEIRIFRGTLRVSTIFASLELVDFMINLVKKTSTKKLQKLDWASMVRLVDNAKYPHLVSYLLDKNLKPKEEQCVLL